MASALAAPPEQGQLVSVRSRNWIVNEVAPSTLPDSGLHGLGDGQTLVSLASVEDDGLGEEIQVVWELEPGTRINEEVALPEPTGFDPPDQLNAFLDAVRWGASSSADVRNIQSPFRSGIDIEDYQLDPVVRAIQMPRVNLLVADDVGLGKTIEAGMVALELIIRHRARKILIVCPSSLQVQWQEQMRDKFGLDFRIVDSELMRDLRRERGIHVNPWNHFPRLITSIDFLKRERPLRMFREILPGPNDPIYPRKFDLLIVDEAHNCAPSGRGKYATDSLRTKALRLLAPHFEHKLFLTATPHNGYPESFSALLELLDNQRFARSTPPDRKQLDAVMVRRMKSELPPRWDGSPRFPKRTLEPLEVPYTDEEKAIHGVLKHYAGLRSKRARDNAESMATDFVLKTLKKRLFSSPAAFLTTLNKHEPSHFGGNSDFSRRTMTASSCLRSGVGAPGEPLVVEQFEQGREALRVAVVRRGGQEELVLEVRGQQPERLGPQRVGGVLAPARRGAVVGLVHDQQVVTAGVDRLVRAGQGLPEQPQRPLPLEEVDAGDEPGEVRPRVDVDAPAAAQLPHQLAVHDAEVEAELVPHLVPPLDLQSEAGQTTRTRRARWRMISSRATMPGLDGLAEAHVVGDQQVDPRHLDGPDHRVELVVLDVDAASGTGPGCSSRRRWRRHPSGRRRGRRRAGRAGRSRSARAGRPSR